MDRYTADTLTIKMVVTFIITGTVLFLLFAYMEFSNPTNDFLAPHPKTKSGLPPINPPQKMVIPAQETEVKSSLYVDRI